MTRNFRKLIEAKWDEGKFVCVGLDSEWEKIPQSAYQNGGMIPTIAHFNSEIIDATKDIACAYKPNIAFYEAWGKAGWEALRVTIMNILDTDVPVILDAKRADIGNTNNGYVRAAFDDLMADAITVHPYLGREALQPFLDKKDKGIFVLCRTSNPGAGEFQDLLTSHPSAEWTDGRISLYERVAYHVKQEWNRNKNCGLVAGATSSYELGRIREITGDLPLLIPGIGAQGGDLEATVKAARHRMIINSSRGIIFASSGRDYAEAARRETLKLHDAIQACLK